MEDLVSLREDLFSGSQGNSLDTTPLTLTTPRKKSIQKEEDGESGRYCDNLSLSKYCLPNGLSAQSTPRKASLNINNTNNHWIVDCRSLDDLDLLKRRGSLRSQFAVTFSDLSLKSSNRTLASYEPPPATSYSHNKDAENNNNTSFLIRPLCTVNPHGICTSGMDSSLNIQLNMRYMLYFQGLPRFVRSALLSL